MGKHTKKPKRRAYIRKGAIESANETKEQRDSLSVLMDVHAGAIGVTTRSVAVRNASSRKRLRTPSPSEDTADLENFKHNTPIMRRSIQGPPLRTKGSIEQIPTTEFQSNSDDYGEVSGDVKLSLIESINELKQEENNEESPINAHKKLRMIQQNILSGKITLPPRLQPQHTTAVKSCIVLEETFPPEYRNVMSESEFVEWRKLYSDYFLNELTLPRIVKKEAKRLIQSKAENKLFRTDIGDEEKEDVLIMASLLDK
ncbi:hypothetical protein HK096_009039, partial [Nowakowskiella sp. JEL0078]